MRIASQNRRNSRSIGQLTDETELRFPSQPTVGNMKAGFLVVSVVVLSVLGICQAAGLMKSFYRRSCPAAENIVRNVTWSHVAKNPNLPAKLLRMHFHDCFVRGCDGSVLLNSTANSTAEKDAIPNLSLAGFDVIDDIKSQLEKACPGNVSCADILALAARDAVSFQFRRSMWKVLTGRRDGKVSLASEALNNIPSPVSNFSTLEQNFKSKGLGLRDLVVLSGGHTVGVGHCNLFSFRLYNFTGKGDQDPSLNAKYAALLKSKCKSLSDTTTTVDMDPGSALRFDNHYYANLEQKKGMFSSDAALLTDKRASNIVKELTNPRSFIREFAQSMMNMGSVQVLTGTAGEIRKECSVINS